MRVLTLAEEIRVELEVRTRENSNASTVLSVPTWYLSTPAQHDHSDLEKTIDDIETTCISLNTIWDSLNAIMRNSHYAVISEDPLLVKSMAKIHQDLNKANIQIDQLKSSTGRFEEYRYNPIAHTRYQVCCT